MWNRCMCASQHRRSVGNSPESVLGSVSSMTLIGGSEGSRGASGGEAGMPPM